MHITDHILRKWNEFDNNLVIRICSLPCGSCHKPHFRCSPNFLDTYPKCFVLCHLNCNPLQSGRNNINFVVILRSIQVYETELLQRIKLYTELHKLYSED